MLDNVLKGRRPRTLRKPRGYRPILELLENRTLLSGSPPGNTVIEFDTALNSLNLSGGPFAMPLASDPTNALGDSVMGYGFVNTQVTLSLTPGKPSNGKAMAFLGSTGETVAKIMNDVANGIGIQQAPIDPNQLDGQTFRVISFFDVFFDIKLTDVDARPGRNFANQATGPAVGGTLTLPNNGPAHMQDLYSAVFDKDLPNYGLVPPPEVAPYIGHFNLEIPLGGDINGNGENDKIKFTLAAHSAGDSNRTFVTLPNGTVIDNFDSAADITGAIVDQSADPPFEIGKKDVNGKPLFGPGGFTGPSSAQSTLMNPTSNPGFSYVDANNNHMFDNGDVALQDKDVADGSFDTDKPEGANYKKKINGAGLVLNGPAITAKKVNFGADGDLKVNTDLTATKDGVDLTSRKGAVTLDDPTIMSTKNIKIDAVTDITSSGDVIKATGPDSRVDLDAGANINLTDATVTATIEVELVAGKAITVAGTSVISATADKNSEAELFAGTAIDVSGSVIKAMGEVILATLGTITADNAQLLACGKKGEGDVEVLAGGNISLKNAIVRAFDQVDIVSGQGDVDLTGADVASLTGSTKGDLFVRGKKITITGASLLAADKLTLNGMVVGIAAVMGKGTKDCPP